MGYAMACLLFYRANLPSTTGCTDGSIAALVPLATQSPAEMDLDVNMLSTNMAMDTNMGGLSSGMSMGMNGSAMLAQTPMDVNQGEMNMVVDEGSASVTPAPANGTPVPANGSGPVSTLAPGLGGTAAAAGMSMPEPANGETEGGMYFPQAGAEMSKRLHLLQGRLIRGVQHAAGLNPRAFR